MPRRAEKQSQLSTPTEGGYRVARYGKSRNFAAYDGEDRLIAVTLYRKGAEEIAARLTEKDRRIAALESRLAAVTQRPASPALPHAGAAPEENMPACRIRPRRQARIIPEARH